MAANVLPAFLFSVWLLNYRNCRKHISVSKGFSMGLPEAGSKPAGFSLPNQDGKSISLADYAGKNVLVWFFPRAFGGG
ncbi:MAG: cytochrome oxidase Cu insertion factor (SCO1/SenC/PrrC family) [Alphaproteobacteria bacterium]|jgi:cytochrome oxidase Cu insertion factor (SCO1/SenC/PrrC family)